VILFDEIEKAHPDVFNILLQIMDDGRLTDGQGRVVNFKNTILIMTSNIGSQYIYQMNLANKEEVNKQIYQVLREHFKPEFLNRVDEIIIFNRLEKEHIIQIVDIQLEILRKRLKEKNIELEVSSKVKEILAERGFDPQYGARPLKRTIQKYIQDPLALQILEGKIKENDKVKVEFDEKQKEIVFKI
ncbi:MAG: AAA family ATPase, partial [Atribacterota bacterium]|nr:AAA family ATPase [Atribacterota bacterium]